MVLVPIARRPHVLAVLVAALALPSVRAQTPTLPSAEEVRAAHDLVVQDGLASPVDTADLARAEAAALAQADLLAPSRWEIPALAAELGPDPERLHAFVRDHLGFDPYPGRLRGAGGALAARAGNAWDRAALLHALAREVGLEARFAFATLDVATAADLLAAAASGARVPLDDPPPEEVVPIDAAVVARARRDHARLLSVLETHDWGMADPERTSAVREHVWVQVATLDGGWRDLDPQAPVGTTLAVAERTSAALPAASAQTVTVRLVAETLDGATLAERTVLDWTSPAEDAAARGLWLYVQPDRAGVGGTIADLMEGADWLPVLLVDGEAVAGTPFPVGGAGGDFFGGFLGGDGEQLVSLRLELETAGPRLEPVRVRRTLLDRASSEDRAAGTIDADALAPLPDDGVPTAFAALHHLMVSVGATNLRDHAVERAFAANFAGTALQEGDAAASYPLHDLLLPLEVADRSLVAASERWIVPGLAAEGARGWIGRPRVFVASLEPFPDVEDGTARTIDLALDGIDVSLPPGADARDAARHRLWYGVLQTALETETVRRSGRAVAAHGARLASVSLAMTGRELSVRKPVDEDRAPAGGALGAALDAGEWGIVVGDGDAFWAVDPGTGATRSVLEPGVRVGWVGGRNYVNSVNSGVRWVIDEATGRTVGFERDGIRYRYTRRPPGRCGGGTEYVVLLGCVSMPAAMTAGMATTTVVVAIVSWSIAVLELIFL